MTKIRETRDTSMIQDRRGGGSGGGFGLPGMGGVGGGGGFGLPMKAGGGLVGLLLLAAVFILPRLLGGGGDTAPAIGSSSGGSSADTCDDEIEAIICGATVDVQQFWQREFATSGRGEYPSTQTVFFSGYTSTGCGQASAQTGPFYCPADGLVYFDLDFLQQLQDQFGATGDLAAQYIVAHEYGHYVQDVLGTSDEVNRASASQPSRVNELSVALELQADCLAGVWAHDANARSQFDSPAEIEEAMNAAAAVGDDRIQQQTTGEVDPDSFTHGTSEQRRSWFTIGYQSGDVARCDTFAG